ncbi:hypothetical protein BMS3Abin04_01065 [bacterium BMS3Abin04]|nr:hypothetical protein BMS3Abin04_01065 [bacterium BMS3Abin04]
MEETNSSSSLTKRIPLPPPPAEALSIIGKPILLAIDKASSTVFTELVAPGTIGTSFLSIKLRAAVLLPISLTESEEGPIKAIPAFSTSSINSAFSDKNPYPG